MKESDAGWNISRNYGHVVVCLADNPHARLRGVADQVGITERIALRLVIVLEEADILKRVKAGWRNRYLINLGAHLRHRLKSHCTVGELLATVLDEPTPLFQQAQASNAGQ